MSSTFTEKISAPQIRSNDTSFYDLVEAAFINGYQPIEAIELMVKVRPDDREIEAKVKVLYEHFNALVSDDTADHNLYEAFSDLNDYMITYFSVLASKRSLQAQLETANETLAALESEIKKKLWLLGRIDTPTESQGPVSD